jgi:peptide/nickel transport system ATP-binding protein
MNGPIIETQDVVKIYTVSAGSFRGKRPLKAVNGVSLKADRGGVLGLVGESGCGKSTMARIRPSHRSTTGGQAHSTGFPGPLLLAQPAQVR